MAGRTRRRHHLCIGVGTSGLLALMRLRSRQRSRLQYLVIGGSEDCGSARASVDALRIGPSTQILAKGQYLLDRFAGIECVTLMAGLGGRTGSHAVVPVAQLAAMSGCELRVTVSAPFPFEGHARAARAVDVLEELSAMRVPLQLVDGREVAKYVPRTTKLSDLFAYVRDLQVAFAELP